MRGVNKVIVLGNAGQDPELRVMPNGKSVCNLSIATSEEWKDKTTGQQQSRTEWHRVVFYERLAEIVGQYVQKGSKIYVEGSLRTRKYQKNGADHYTTEIVADQMQLLDARNGSETEPARDRPAPQRGIARLPAAAPAVPEGDIFGGDSFDDDIPF